MYAVIETGSKQYRVEVGTELEVELLDAEPGQTINLERVLLVADGDTSAIGRPVVDGATVSAEVVRRDRGDKVISFKYRPKARRRVKKGHRQELTVIRVADIVFGGRSAAEDRKKAEAAAKTERQRLEEAAARQAAEDAALAAKLAKSAPKPEAKADAKADAKSTAKPAAKASTKAPAKTDAKADAKSAPKADAKPAAKPAAASKPATAPKRPTAKKD
ncbi:MAG TPA: 50S ribosomal protein L21, partial [Candidatus Binatia bacterium]|nr:50S ribosomal protein L21 [Candidatus Binatia bacterium]